MRRRDLLLAMAAPRPSGPVRLSIGTYGMQGLELDRALALIGDIGFDGAELCLMPGWPSEPARLDAAARRRIRGQRVAIPTMIENFNTLASAADHGKTLDRIGRAAELAHDVAPKAPPLLQTVLGGSGQEWDQVKDQMAARLADWARAAERNRLRLAVKSHFGSASDTPEKLIWLLDRVKSPALSGIYDYGHFQLLGLGLRATLDVLLGRSSFITVKDSRLVGDRAQFLLPGDGTVDYGEYFGYLKERGWRGWVLAEVSRQLQTVAGYDAEEAARRSYLHVAGALGRAGLRAGVTAG